jgi:hypothetical protein
MATVYVGLDPKSAILSSSAVPELVLIVGTNGPVMGYAFDATTREDIYFSIPLLLYGSGNITLTAKCYSRAGSTTGAFVLGARIACITAGDAQSMETKNWATAQQSSSTTINSTAKGPTGCTVTISNLDSATVNDEMWLNVYRLPADAGDTMSGDLIITNLYLSYSDT